METDDRTVYEAKLDISYAAELHRRHVRLYRHFGGTCTYLTLVASALAAMLVPTHPLLASGLATLVVILNMAVVTIRPETKAADHADMRRRWLELKADAGTLSIDEIDRKIAELNAVDVHTLDSLSIAAYNANLRTHGHQAMPHKLSVRERLMGWIS